jgi:chromosome segregation ATPase
MVGIQITYHADPEEIRAAVMRSLIDEVARRERGVHPGRSLAGALRQVWEETGNEGSAFVAYLADLLVALRAQLTEAQETARRAHELLEGERRVARRLWNREREAHAATKQRLAQLEESLERRRFLALKEERDALRRRVHSLETERAALKQQIGALQAELTAQARLIAHQQAELKQWRAAQEE